MVRKHCRTKLRFYFQLGERAANSSTTRPGLRKRDAAWDLCNSFINACRRNRAQAVCQRTHRHFVIVLRPHERPTAADSHHPSCGKARRFERCGSDSQGVFPRRSSGGFFSSSFDTPDFLLAAKRSSNSDRPVETLTPSATALHMTLNSRIADADYPTLAQQILTDPSMRGWPYAVFHRVWRIQPQRPVVWRFARVVRFAWENVANATDAYPAPAVLRL